jgi:hypothetical protein
LLLRFQEKTWVEIVIPADLAAFMRWMGLIDPTT